MSNLAKFPTREIDFGDGDDGNTSEGIVVIELVDNGYVLSMESDDGETKMVFTDKKELLKYLNGVL